MWTVNTSQTFDEVTATLSITTGENDFIDYSETPTSTLFTIDNDAPGIESLEYDSENNIIEISFNEPIFALYENQTATGTITPEHFALSISGGTAQIDGNQPQSVSVSGTTYSIAFSLNGSINGEERLFINPGSPIYDHVGNNVDYEENSVYVDLIDDTSPFVTSSNYNQDQGEITLVFNEKIIGSSSSNFDSSTASSTEFIVPTQTTPHF